MARGAGAGLPLRACYTAQASCSPCSTLLKRSPGRAGDRDQQVRGHSRAGLWGEAWKRTLTGLGRSQGSSQQQQQHSPPRPLHTLAAGPEVQSSAQLCCFAFRIPGGGKWVGRQWGQLRKTGLLGEPMVVVVSEVKLIQVPRALPASRAPHPAIIALQLFLSLPFLLGLFGSLHLVREGKQSEL